ncbi:MAG: OmpA family protein [bacterium]
MISKRIVALILFWMSLAGAAYSAQNGFEIMSFRPATDNGRYLSVWDSHVLDKGEWFIGTTFDYSYRPFQLTTNGAREAGVLDKIFEQHLYSSVGIVKNRLELGIDIPIGWWMNYKDPRVATSVAGNKTALGDITINAKVRLLDMDRSKVGLAVLPFISLPSGNSDYYFGSGVVTAGATLIAETNPFKKLFVAMNLGLLAKKNYTFRDIDDTSKLTGGLGVAVPATKNLNVSADLIFKTRLSGVFREKVETPVELLTGIKYNIGNTGFVINGAVGGGLINGAGAPQYRIIFGLGYDRPPCKGSTISTTKYGTATGLPYMTSERSIHFAFNSIEIQKTTETIQFDNIAELLRSDATKKIVVEGNADNIGSKSVNNRISRQRAEVVAKYINKRGVDRSRMTIKAFGSSNPIADNNTKQGRQANRRVEVKVQEGLK